MLLKKEGYLVVGAAMEVYNHMRSGFLEEVYQECMELELKFQNIPYTSQIPLHLWYKDRQLKKMYKPDLIVFDEVIVELKAAKCLTSEDESQILNYLKGTRKKVGYLINFGDPKNLTFKRMVYGAAD